MTVFRINTMYVAASLEYLPGVYGENTVNFISIRI